LLLAQAALALGQNRSESHVANRRTPVVIAVEKVAPAVANISTEQVVVHPYFKPHSGGSPFRTPDEVFDNLSNDFFGRLQYVPERVENPLGSGALIDEDGYIVTNQHVIRKASTLKITLYGDKSVYQAQLISAEPQNDMAVLKISSPKPFHYIPLGTSSDLMLGETVIALGNPLGFATSISVGIVSAKDRQITVGGMKYASLIQTDAAINPGNSGGPLVNINGEMIGINTAIVASAEGIGFAVPVDKVKKTLAELFRFEESSKMRIGLEVEDTSAEGVAVRSVDANSPAWRAGFKPGDVITKVDKEPTDSAFVFWKHAMKRNPGDTIGFTVKRAGDTLKFSLVAEQAPKPAAEKLAESKLGISVRVITPQLARRLRLPVQDGIIVEKVEPNSPADRAGLQPNDVIPEVAGRRIRTMDELGTLLKHVRPGDLVDVTVIRGEYVGYARMASRS
jgi:serine protease Do